jgi:hypothetical protein
MFLSRGFIQETGKISICFCSARSAEGARGYTRHRITQEVIDDRRRVLDGANGCRRAQEVRKDTEGCERGSRGEEWCRRQKRK